MILNIEESEPLSLQLGAFLQGVFVDFTEKDNRNADWELLYHPFGGLAKRALPDIKQHIQKRSPIRVHGNLSYKTNGDQIHRYQFQTKVYFESQHAVQQCDARPPTFEYNAFLRSGRAGYIERRPIAQEIKPGEVDQFLLRIATDRSASFDLVMSINDVSGRSLWQGNIDMKVLVPRDGAPVFGVLLPIKEGDADPEWQSPGDVGATP
jgi:hypothetical protein